MVGYIGSKAVTLSTTAADVTGDATINGNLTVNGTTVTIDSAAAQEIRLGDNDKMTFGDATGGDLQIYHDGTNSYVGENGTGDLRLTGNSITMLKADATETYAQFLVNGAVNLFYDNSKKLATTSTGIDVTGTVTADGLTVDGGTAYHKLISTFPATYTTNLQVGQQVNISNNAVTDTLSIENTGTAAATNIQFSTAGSERMRIDNSGRVGIGTSSPSETLDVLGTGQVTGGNSAGIDTRFTVASSGNGGSGRGVGLVLAPAGSSNSVEAVRLVGFQNTAAATANNAAFAVQVSNTSGTLTERMRIDSSGNVGIGTFSPNIANFGKALTITDPAASDQIPAIELAYGSNTRGANIAVDNRASVKAFAITSVASDLAMTFGTNNTERMRIDSSGNLLVGQDCNS